MGNEYTTHAGPPSGLDNAGPAGPADTASETDSDYSTASLRSSIYQYRFENGRRYHAYKDGQYPFPNDEKEQERLDIIHHIYTLLFPRLILAPIGPDPRRILDIGTGTGIWAIDVAERFPAADIIGTDLSPIQPSWVPPNVTFIIDDAEADWTWEKASFDLIHIRHLAGAIADWPKLLRQAYDCLKPGAYLEIQDYDMGLFSDDGTYSWCEGVPTFYDAVNKAAEKAGRPFFRNEAIRPLLEHAGFTDLSARMLKVPVGLWPADKRQRLCGAYSLLAAETGFEAVGMALLVRGG